ncbi:MAG: mucoidy inhibitor MuiA family protein, partial [Myxococcota bacterium]
MSCLVLALLFAAPPPPKIAQVVVYPDRAQVTRAEKVTCTAQPRAVAFGQIPPAAEPASVRARVRGGTLEGLRTEVRTRQELYAPELSALETQVKKLELEAAVLRDEKERAQGGARLGGSFADVAVSLVSREMTEPKPDVKAWGAAFDVSYEARRQAALEATRVDAELRQLSYQLEDLRRKMTRLSAAAQRRELYAEVLMSCPAGNSAQVELTYLVGGASWQPAYEARAEESEGRVALSTFATVSQATGEDWTRAELILSTAVPSQNATPPELRPLRVYAEKREEEKKVLVRRDEKVEHAMAADALAAPGEEGLRARGQGLSVQLSVPEAADVPGDGAPVRLFVGKVLLRARFSYRAVPKLLPFVFRVAELSNAAPYPLLPGPLDAFRQGAFIARTPLERVPQGGAFQLTFGIEEKLRVARVVLEEVQRDTGLFGGNRRFRYGYRFELANYGPRTAEVELAEHVPVSELDDVKVELAAKTTSGYQL